MNLDLPVFDLRNLKRSFYFFLVLNVTIGIVGILFKGSLSAWVDHDNVTRYTTWIVFYLLLFPTVLYSVWSKKEIKKITAITDYTVQFEKYERFYKKRLLWNTLSVVISAAFVLILNNNSFFYLMIIQSFLSIMFFPGKRVISKELNNNDIVFI